MKASSVANVAMNIIYVFAILGVIGFLALGVVPADMEVDPINLEMGVDAEYPVSDSEDILEMNIKDVIGSNEGGGAVSIYEKGESVLIYVISEGADDTEIDKAINDIKKLDESKFVLLKDANGEVLRQEMMYRSFNELTVEMYTEVSITNNLRYSLNDISVNIDMMNEDGAVEYRILESAPTTFATGESGTLPIHLEINMVNISFMMISGGESIETYLGIDISGSYYFGLAGASIYATASIGSPDDTATIEVDIEEDKITVTGDKVEDSLFPIPSKLDATIGDVKIEMKNDDTGFEFNVDTGASGMSIVDALEEQYEDGDYTIDLEGETVTLEKEQYAQMIDILKQIMEANA